MENRQQKIEHEVNQTLNAFDQAPHLQAGPWFARRVRKRLDSDEAAIPLNVGDAWHLGWLRPALLVLIVTLNLVTAVVAFQRSDDVSEARETYVNSLASDYAYKISDTYFTLED
ncbi:hypothetical protein ACFL6U_21195 [Planctomycetota bacterium]